MLLTIQNIIKKKKHTLELSTEEIRYFTESVVNGTASDAQIGAFLMAVCLNGMNDRETADLTKAMVDTGLHLEWKAPWRNLVVDKHSTGGVGDKISLILAPALAACGLKVPMVSGRGLGFTGGTLDKLESIPGFQVILTPEEMYNCLDNVGCFIAGQTESIAPADRIMYKHRDSTGTIDNLPLIVSSILSKKAVEGISALVMDVKVGSGGHFESVEMAEEIAYKLIDVSKKLNIETAATLTDMSTPLGRYVGNALEIMESIRCLKNNGPKDIEELVRTMGGLLLHKKGIVKTTKEGENLIKETLENQSALGKFREMLIFQGVSEQFADALCNENFTNVLPTAKFITKFKSHQSGIVRDIIAKDIGEACWYLGTGRSKSDGAIDHAVGVKLLKIVGDEVEVGEEWIEIHHSEKEINEHIQNLIHRSLKISQDITKNLKQSKIVRILNI